MLVFTCCVCLRRVGSLRALLSRLNCPRPFLNLISFRKISITWEFDQQNSMDHRVLHQDGDLPLVYILSRIQGIASFIKEINEKIPIKEVLVPDGDHIPASDVQTSEIVICEAPVLSYNYQNMPLLKWAHCTWAGIDPLFEAIKIKPPFIVTKHAHDDFSLQIAEYVITHMLLIENKFREIWEAQKEKNWIKMVHCSTAEPVRQLKDITLGILGVGNMGQAIAKFAKPHGTKVIGLAKSPREMSEFGVFDRIEVSLTEVLSAADYIVNTLPSTAETVGMLNGDVLQACGERTVFINVGRGDIVHEDTLLKALNNGWLRHVVLDVFQEEPLPKYSVLWNCNHATLTPHCAAISRAKYIAEDFVGSYLNYLQNQPMRNVVDWDKGY